MRLFVGIPAPPGPAFAAVAQTLEGRGGRAVPDGTWHVTLRFLGDVEDHDVPRVSAALGDAARGRPAMPAVIEGVGAFPDPKHARVAWAGVRADGLEALAHAVEQATAPFGEPPERRRFVGHVTLARFKRPADLRSLVDAHRGTLFAQGRLDRLVLYASTPGPGGAHYQQISSEPLGA